jgi:hypothetical protein
VPVDGIEMTKPKDIDVRQPCSQCGRALTAKDQEKARPGFKLLCSSCRSAVDEYCKGRDLYESRYDRFPTRPGFPCAPAGWSGALLRGWQDLHPDTRLSGYEESFEDDELQ